MRIIELSKREIAFVDDEDYVWLPHTGWAASPYSSKQQKYRAQYKDGTLMHRKMDRYTTLEEARLGHERMVARVQQPARGDGGQ